MTTTTFATVCPNDEWTVIHDGSGAATMGLQIGGVSPVAIGVGTAEPTGSAYFVLALNGDRSVAFDLADGDKVYGKSLDAVNGGKIRGYKVVS